MTDQELINLKKSIESVKRKQSEVEGKKKALLESLDKKFGCATVQQAQKELTRLKAVVEELDKEKSDKISELERDYEF